MATSINSDSPTVSIITPVFQTDLKYVKKCIQSVATQSYSKDKVEMIICIDPSGVGYSKKLEDLCSSFRTLHIELEYNQDHLGLAKSRNRAVHLSGSDWLFMLDSDDFLEKRAIESLVRVGDHATALVYGDHAKVTSDLKETEYIRRKRFYHSLLNLFARNPLYNPLYSSVYISHGMLIRKSVFLEVGGYTNEIGETPPLLIDIFERAGVQSIKHVPEIVYYYRDNKNGIANRMEPELIRTHELTFLNHIKKHNPEIMSVRYIGRVKPFMAKHFSFCDNKGKNVEVPYLDYAKLSLINMNNVCQNLTCRVFQCT